MLQTTGNTHPGGDSGGLLTSSKLAIWFLVAKADKTPTISGIATHSASFFYKAKGIIIINGKKTNKK